MTENSRSYDRLCGHGDIREIANITGYNVSYVRKVLDSQRSNNIISDIADDLIRMRERVRRKYKILMHGSGKNRSFSRMTDVENLLVDMQFRPTRRLMDSALRRLHSEQGSVRPEAIINAREELSLYDRHILKSLDWLNTQRIQVEAYPEPFLLWPVVQYAASFVRMGTADIKVRLEENEHSHSILADPHLTGTLVRSLIYHMLRITAPGGEVTVSATDTTGTPVLIVESRPCLLNRHSLSMLNDTSKLKVTRSQADNLEAVAVAGQFIMELQDGALEWKMHAGQTASVALSFAEGASPEN
ncbi:MAG: hypothetical protein WBB45_02175 [Cyclobacteriaceae bacterium]